MVEKNNRGGGTVIPVGDVELLKPVQASADFSALRRYIDDSITKIFGFSGNR